jgi:zinc protease
MDRTAAPAFTKSIEFELPPPERYSLRSGAELIYLPSKLSEAVKIEFIFRAGKIYEPFSSVAQFTAQLIDKGIPGKSANQIASTLDYYGAHLESRAGFDFATVSLYCLRKHVGVLLPLLLLFITEASFPEEELETHKKISSENLKVNLQKNSFIGSNELRKSLFGNHAYGTSSTQEDIKVISTKHLNAFYKRYFSPFKIFVVGDLHSPDLQSLCDYPYAALQLNLSDSNFEQPKVINRTIDGPNKTQASLWMGKISINRMHPDIAEITLLNHILGGFFGSRLMKNIREEKGLTYGIFSGIQHRSLCSYMSISADINADRVEETILEIKKELEQLATSQSIEELSLAKNHLIGTIQNDSSTIFSVGERIKTIVLDNLPTDYYKKLIQTIDSTEALNKIKEISTHLLSPDSFSSVVVK